MDDAAYNRIQELYNYYMRVLYSRDMYALVQACENDPLVRDSTDIRVYSVLGLFKMKLTQNRNWRNHPRNQNYSFLP